MPQPTNGIIDKIALVYIRDRKLLFARTHGQSLFYMPGGKREAGETDMQALGREIREELGTDIADGSLKFMRVFEGPAHNKPEGTMLRLTCYAGSLDCEPKPSSEIDEIAFLSSLDEVKLSEAGRSITRWLKSQGMID